MWLKCSERACSPADQGWSVVADAGPARTLSPWFHCWWPFHWTSCCCHRLVEFSWKCPKCGQQCVPLSLKWPWCGPLQWVPLLFSFVLLTCTCMWLSLILSNLEHLPSHMTDSGTAGILEEIIFLLMWKCSFQTTLSAYSVWYKEYTLDCQLDAHSWFNCRGSVTLPFYQQSGGLFSVSSTLRISLNV